MGTVATRCDIGVAVFPLFPGFGQHAGPSIVRTVCIKLPCFYFSGWSHFYGDTHGLQGGEGLCVCKTCEWQWDRRRVGKEKKNEEGGWCKFCGAPPQISQCVGNKALNCPAESRTLQGRSANIVSDCGSESLTIQIVYQETATSCFSSSSSNPVISGSHTKLERLLLVPDCPFGLLQKHAVAIWWPPWRETCPSSFLVNENTMTLILLLNMEETVQ